MSTPDGSGKRRRVSQSRAKQALEAISQNLVSQQNEKDVDEIASVLKKDPELTLKVKAFLRSQTAAGKPEQCLYRGTRTLQDIPMKYVKEILEASTGHCQANWLNIPNSKQHVLWLFLWASGEEPGFELPNRSMRLADVIQLYKHLMRDFGDVLHRYTSWDAEPDWNFRYGHYGLVGDEDHDVHEIVHHKSGTTVQLPMGIVIRAGGSSEWELSDNYSLEKATLKNTSMGYSFNLKDLFRNMKKQVPKHEKSPITNLAMAQAASSAGPAPRTPMSSPMASLQRSHTSGGSIGSLGGQPPPPPPGDGGGEGEVPEPPISS